jgi:hypothetical protein
MNGYVSAAPLDSSCPEADAENNTTFRKLYDLFLASIWVSQL